MDNDLQTLPLLSLFSGAGGLDRGFEAAGFCPMLALDADPSAVETYNHNRTHLHEASRICDLSTATASGIIQQWEEIGDKGLRPVGIIGGPPCQAFSISNVNKLADDPRARLPLAYARILGGLNERFDLEFFVFENVGGLATRAHAPSLEAFVTEFEKAGFGVTRFFLDAVNFGVPQYRNRMFIVGFNSKRYRVKEFVLPTGTGTARTVRQTIEKLVEPLHFRRNDSPAEYGLHPNHWCMNPRSKKFGNGAMLPGEMRGRSFRRLLWDSPSWTVAYGHREVHVHPNGKRRLSVYEAMLLQAFPNRYELCGTLSDQIRLVSDAVPPPVAEALAARIREFIWSSIFKDDLGPTHTKTPQDIGGREV